MVQCFIVHARGNNQQEAVVHDCCNRYCIMHHGVRASSTVGAAQRILNSTQYARCLSVCLRGGWGSRPPCTLSPTLITKNNDFSPQSGNVFLMYIHTQNPLQIDYLASQNTFINKIHKHEKNTTTNRFLVFCMEIYLWCVNWWRSRTPAYVRSIFLGSTSIK